MQGSSQKDSEPETEQEISQTKTSRISAYLIAKHEANEPPPSLTTMVRDTGTSMALCRYVRTLLIKQGILPALPSPLGMKKGPKLGHGPRNVGNSKPPSPEEIMRRVLAGEVESISKEQRKQILSEYIRTSPAYVTKGMIETLTKLESDDGDKESYTPPLPMTAGEVIERTSRILKAYGSEIAHEAMRVAFEVKGELASD